MNPLRRIVGRITEFFTTASDPWARTVNVGRAIRRSISAWSAALTPWRQTIDWGRPDYAFWQAAYYCRARGLELSGLFIKPLVNKVAAWTLGRSPRWKTDDPAGGEALEAWWGKYHADILRGWRAALKQGDSFVVVNSDLTVTIVAPDNVFPIVDDANYAAVVGYRVVQNIPHPDRAADRMVITDEYYADRRIHRVERNGAPTQVTTYPNLIKRLPIVHIANQPDDGEMYGHAEAEPLIEILQRYGETFEAAIEGNKRQGRPTPVFQFETIQDLDKFWETYGETETQTQPDGSTKTYESLAVDLNQIITVSGASFEFKAPGSFSSDTVALLGLMFYLILQHSEIPEFVFGNAIASSQASANTQMPVFIEYIKLRQGAMAAWLIELATIVLAYLSLTTPGVQAEIPALQWRELGGQDGQLTLDTLTWAFTEGLIDRKTALMLAPVEVEDIDAVLDAAAAESGAAAAQFPETQGGGQAMDQQLQDEINSLEI